MYMLSIYGSRLYNSTQRDLNHTRACYIISYQQKEKRLICASIIIIIKKEKETLGKEPVERKM